MQNILLLKNREEYDNAPKCELGKKIMALYENSSGLEYIINDIGNYFIATYNVTSTTIDTSLINSKFDLSQISLMYIDGNIITEPINKYKFNEIGKHDIKCSYCKYENGINVATDINVINMSYMFYNCDALIEVTFSDNFDTSNVTDMQYMFTNCSKLTSITFNDNFDTSNVTTMHCMFYNCSGLTELDLSNFDTSKVTDMSYMFYGCNKLTSITINDNFNTLAVTNMSYMFYGCSKLTSLNLNNFNTSNVTTMFCMFENCSGLISLDLSSFDTSNVTNMSWMFYGCGNLTSLDLNHFDTSNVTTMYCMFENCTSLISLDLSNFNTSKVTSMSYMFDNCQRLTSLDLTHFDTSNVTTMEKMFYDCSYLTSLDLSSFDTSNVTKMNEMFSSCSGLTSLDLSNFDTSNVTNMDAMFANCSVLTSIIMLSNVYKVISYSNMFSNLPSNGTFTYPCAYSDAWNKLLNNLPSTWIKQCQALVVTNKIKIIENGVEITSGNVIVNNITCTFDEIEQVWECEYLAEQQNYIIYLNDVEIGVTNHAKLQYVFIGNNNGSYNGFNIIETISASSTSSSYSLIYSSFTPYIDAMLIDGEQVSISSAKTFSSVGEHTVQIIMDTSNVTSMTYMFSGCTNLTSIEFGDNFDTSNVTSMYRMFRYCERLTSLDLSSFDTSNVTDMSYMFYDCYKLTSLNISNFDTSNVTDMSAMFYICSGLTSLNISNFDTSNVTNMNAMFYNCYKLTSLDVSSFNTSKVTNMSYIFYCCSGLTELDLSDFDTSKVTDMSYMFYKSTKLNSIEFGNYGDVSKVTSYAYMFSNVPSTCILTLCENTKESWTKISKPSNTVYNNCYIPTACTELTITALDVNGRATSTTITYSAVINGFDKNNNEVSGITITGTAESAQFEQNTDTANTVTRTITFEYLGVTASTTITQGVWVSKEYLINLNDQWRLSTSITNPDSYTYDGVYESFAHKGVDNSSDICIITIEGYKKFTLYVRSYAESNYDYVVVSNLDCALNNGTTSGSYVKATTSGKSTSDTSINGYTKVEFTNIDGKQHIIQVMYRKDSSGYVGTDSGYLLIPKKQ